MAIHPNLNEKVNSFVSVRALNVLMQLIIRIHYHIL